MFNYNTSIEYVKDINSVVMINRIADKELRDWSMQIHLYISYKEITDKIDYSWEISSSFMSINYRINDEIDPILDKVFINNLKGFKYIDGSKTIWQRELDARDIEQWVNAIDHISENFVEILNSYLDN